MAWIPSDTNMGRHPKTRRFARELSTSVPTAMGYLHLFWHWCMEFASNGYVTQNDVIDVTEAALWEGDPQLFFDALIRCGFIDKTENELAVHDWNEYGGKYLEKKNSNTERQAKYRERKKAKRDKPPTDSNGDITPDSNRHNNNGNDDITVTSHESNAVDKNRIDKNRIEKSTTTDVVVNAHEENSAPAKEKNSTTSASANSEILNLTPEREAMLNAVLDVVGKKADWYDKTLAKDDRETVAKILHKIERDKRTLEEINGFMDNFAGYVRRDPSTVVKPFPQQMLRDLDRVLNWKPPPEQATSIPRKSGEEIEALIKKFAKVEKPGVKKQGKNS